MATKNTALRNAMADDFGTLFNSGSIIIRDSSNATLVTFSLHTTAFDAAAEGVIEAAAASLVEATATGTGTADNAILQSSDSSMQVTGLTVGTSAAQVLLSDLAIETGQAVTLTQFSWTEGATVN